MTAETRKLRMAVLGASGEDGAQMRARLAQELIVVKPQSASTRRVARSWASCEACSATMAPPRTGMAARIGSTRDPSRRTFRRGSAPAGSANREDSGLIDLKALTAAATKSEAMAAPVMPTAPLISPRTGLYNACLAVGALQEHSTIEVFRYVGEFGTNPLSLRIRSLA